MSIGFDEYDFRSIFLKNGFRFFSFHVQIKIGQKIVYLKIGPKIKLYPAKISLEHFFDKKKPN
jgi:hypothetical protein